MLLLAVWLAILLTAHSLYLPERARGGELYRRFVAQNGDKKVEASNALTWNAPVDHFSNLSSTFTQRYYVNDNFWDGKGPVFYEIGGEGTLTGPPGGYIAQLGEKYNALLISLEHRFYGESIPNGNVNTENYAFLTVEQALADLASFTDYYKGINLATKNVPWFVFGGSYPGALSSWYRAVYPGSSVGSLSSSGVVNCIVDYYQFDMSVSSAAGNVCTDNIRRIQSAFEQTIEQSQDGFDYALNLFNCEKDMSHNDFYYMIADSWSMMIQYSAKSQLCDGIALPSTATNEEVMSNFAELSNKYWGKTFCSGGFYNTKQLADPKRWEVNSRSWRYQTCDQVSYFNTAPPSGSLRAQSVNLDYHLTQCAQVFGKKMYPTSAELNQKFGGEFPKAKNVFYSDFSDDPWQRASVSYPVSSAQPFFLAKCDNCGHCLDFHTATVNDPQPLKDCRADFERYVSTWINEFNHTV